MKKLYLFSFLLILSAINIFSQSGWFWQNPLSTTAKFNEIQFVNPSTGYSCGWDANNNRGFCIKTTNGGKSWIVVAHANATAFASLKFINNTGYVVGYPNLWKTIDAGNFWSILPLNTATSPFWPSINFVNEYTGFLNGEINIWNNLYKTTDGGNSFSTSSPGISAGVLKVFIVDANIIYLSGEFGLFSRSTNIGNTWNTQQISPYYQLRSLYFTNATTGFICGNGYYANPSPGRIYKTTNSGNNWTELILPLRPKSFSEMEFTDINNGYAIGDSGCVLRTVNAGVNWEVMRIAPNQLLNDIALMNFDSGYVAGNNGILLKMKNQGSSFETLNYAYRKNFNSVIMVNDILGFAVGDSGIIMKYCDGIWYPGFNNNTHKLNSVDFADSLIGIAVGDSGVVIKTTNQGTNWFSEISNTNLSFNSVQFLNNICYVVGDSGKIVKSTNLGISWYSVQSNTSTNQNDILQQNSNTVYIVGDSGLVLKTTNSGNNWVNLPSGTTSNLNSISATSFDTIFIVGENLILKKSTNGGVSWANVTLPLSQITLNDIVFTSTSVGYITGDFGRIYKTTNFGANWGYQNINLTNNINSISFLNSNTGFIVGSGGMIRKTTNAGGIILGVFSNNENIPLSFFLYQNYPNPFNPVTKIKFDIPNQSIAKIIIYDLLGREVTILVNEQLKPGSYSVDWDGSGFASGVYFYSLVTNDFVETKRMVLIK
ncbi:MAG: T9SS type A sorting domain-containing protein [Ignavibacteria bacterium]|nr:T9SS type A sorting domain-containing protein [Ignavibacteria bacterium]